MTGRRRFIARASGVVAAVAGTLVKLKESIGRNPNWIEIVDLP